MVGLATGDEVADGVADGVEVGSSSNAENTAAPESSPIKLCFDLAIFGITCVLPFAKVNVVLADEKPK